MDSITELGVELGISTYGWLLGRPKKLTSIDIREYPEAWKLLREAASDMDVDFSLVVSDDTKIRLEEVDLLFVDSLHTYGHVTKQLRMHAHVVSRYIVFHDILENDGVQSQQRVDLRKAVDEFLVTNKEWKHVTVKRPCGLFIIEKQPE